MARRNPTRRRPARTWRLGHMPGAQERGWRQDVVAHISRADDAHLQRLRNGAQELQIVKQGGELHAQEAPTCRRCRQRAIHCAISQPNRLTSLSCRHQRGLHGRRARVRHLRRTRVSCHAEAVGHGAAHLRCSGAVQLKVTQNAPAQVALLASQSGKCPLSPHCQQRRTDLPRLRRLSPVQEHDLVPVLQQVPGTHTRWHASSASSGDTAWLTG